MTFFGTELTFIDGVRLVISIMFVLFMLFVSLVMWRNSNSMNQLLRQAIEDREAREQAVRELQVTATELAQRTQAALQANGHDHRATENGEP